LRRQKTYYDLHVREKDFQVGDKVWLYDPGVAHVPSKALRVVWTGPWEVSEIRPGGVFVIQKARASKVVHGNRLRKYFGREELFVDDLPVEDTASDPIQVHVADNEEVQESDVVELAPNVNDRGGQNNHSTSRPQRVKRAPRWQSNDWELTID
jgi:hypothetical protein